MGQTRIADRYTLLDRHATGGMATVWRARDEWTREVVAIKRLHPHVVADPVARARLEREAEALRAVDHPAIVRPRGLIDDPDAPSLVMDFVSGRPLSERIAEGPLPPDEAVAIAGVVADALAVAHDQGIIHRDIKPSNILVDDDGAVHLIDFGIAALMDAPPDGLTATSTMVGTLRYAAPERLAGGEISPRSDVWALGAVLYEMLTGHPAVRATDPAGALVASQAAPATLDGVPPHLASIIGRAMATDPASRYPDAVALRDALAEDAASVDANAVTAVVPVAVSPSPAVAPSGPDPTPAALGRTLPRDPVVAASRGRRSVPLGLLAAGLVLGVVVLLALAGSNLLVADRPTPTDAGAAPAATASEPPTGGNPVVVKETPKPKAEPDPKGDPKPGKGKGRDKKDE
jgi:eukaryotic-like serine/threonine-protein kinase